MVGDGVNDAAALALADVGIAVLGGTGASIVAADVVLTREGTAPLLDLLTGARSVFRVIARNLGLSLAYNAAGATLAVLGLVGPLLAAVLMPASSLTVTLSSALSRTFVGRAASGGGFTPPQRAGSLRGAAQPPQKRGAPMELILVLLPFALLFAGIALALFVWAARSGQFDDLETPAVRILFDDETPAARARRRRSGADGQTRRDPECADPRGPSASSSWWRPRPRRARWPGP